MSKTVPANLQTHLNGELTTLATLWKVTRQDATVLGFTDHDRDITYDSVTYQAASAYNRTAIRSTANLAVDNLDLDGLLDSAAISAADLQAGLYDYASVEIMLINWSTPSDGVVILRTGTLGEITLRDNTYVAELRGLSQALSRNIIELYTPQCGADLGDSRCNITIASYTESGTVDGVTDARTFTHSDVFAEDDGYFNGGKIVWTRGANDGLSMEIKDWDKPTKAITLFLPMPYAVAIDDTFDMQAGCNKSLATCISKYDNIDNFRGYGVFIPGLDQVLDYPDAIGG